MHRLRTGVVWLTAVAFAADGVVRGYLLAVYQAAPDSALVLGASANSNARERGEYVAVHWRAMAGWAAVLVISAVFLGRYVARGARGPLLQSRWSVALFAIVILVAGIAYASKPWRRLHPLAFWANWGQSVQAFRAGWADQQQARERALARARAAAPALDRDGRATIVLVIADSINRDNMTLYGYQRATTPRLSALKAQLQEQLLVMRNAWSVDASTLPALHNIFRFGSPQGEEPQHVLALARAAGYKVWWMSNHDDVAIEQEHARLADVVDMVNRTPGRSGVSLDGELLGRLGDAIEDAAEHKLIVIHLMGAHPHYRLRFPDGANPFDDRIDEVDELLANSGRSAWVRKSRKDYDAALLYHDFVVSEILQLTRALGANDEYRAWMYLSDHGQEVGHEVDRVGHSPSTTSGYRIPTVIWRNSASPPYPSGATVRPFRSDWAGWTIADLLNLRWHGEMPDRNVLRETYRWQAPTLPVEVKSFNE